MGTMSIQPGLAATVAHQVTQDDTALAHGSGDVTVWATPAVVALCEAAAVDAVKGELEDGETTVGTHVDLQHLAPSPVGASVQATATVESVDGRRLRFSVEAAQDGKVVARGSHSRVRVDRDRFLGDAAR
jgi:fluoroacetyl-CoA thioesterase